MKVQHGPTTVSSDAVQIHVWAGAVSRAVVGMLTFFSPSVQLSGVQLVGTGLSGYGCQDLTLNLRLSGLLPVCPSFARCCLSVASDLFL